VAIWASVIVFFAKRPFIVAFASSEHTQHACHDCIFHERWPS
jgi:hypothetical protein